MSSADDGSEPRTASSGTMRTPPPRTRRGAPTTRPSFDELDELDALIEPEPTVPAPVTAKASSTTKKAPSAESPPGSSKVIDWDAPATTTNRDATVLASAAAATTASAEPYGDPVEPEIPFEPASSPRPAKVKAAKRPERRFRQTVQKIDLWSVTKMALCFYVSAMGVVVVSLSALWVVAQSAGIIDNVEKFIGDLFSSKNFHFASAQVLRGTVLIGVVVVALMVVFTIIAASFYNIFAELFGGIEIVIREEEQPPKR